MKLLRWSVLALVLVALPAGAQTRTDGQTASPSDLRTGDALYDSGAGKWRVKRGNASGQEQVEVVNGGQYLFAPSLVATDSLGSSKFGGDSTGVFDARYVRDPVLLIRLSNMYLNVAAIVRVAVSIRVLTAAAQDTTVLFNWLPPRAGSISASGDTLGSAAIPTLMTQSSGAPVAGTAATFEHILTFSAGYPPLAIPLTGLKGARISVKIRPLSYSTALAAPKLWIGMIANGL